MRLFGLFKILYQKDTVKVAGMATSRAMNILASRSVFALTLKIHMQSLINLNKDKIFFATCMYTVVSDVVSLKALK